MDFGFLGIGFGYFLWPEVRTALEQETTSVAGISGLCLFVVIENDGGSFALEISLSLSLLTHLN